MRSDLRSAWLPWAILGALAAALGVGLAVASSPGSLGRGIPRAAAGSPSVVLTPPLPSPRPAPLPLKPGQLKLPLELRLLGTGLYIFASDRSLVSSDGTTWQPLPAGGGGAPVLADPSNPARFLSGGASLQVSTDGGKSWRPTPTPPPGTGPFQPLAVSSIEPGVWFILHQGRIDRTRDEGVSWRELAGLPTLGASPVFVSGVNKGQFFLANDSQVFEFTDNGQQIQNRGQVPGGSPVTALVQGSAGSPGGLVARTAAGGVYLLRDGAWADAKPPFTGTVGGSPGHYVLVADGGTEVGVPGRVAVSTDGGVVWDQATGLPADQSVAAVAGGPDALNAYAYCAGGDVYRSTDGGRTWALMASPFRSAPAP